MFINNCLNEAVEKVHGLSKKVLQIHPITLQIVRIWNSASEIGRELKIEVSMITSVCRDRKNQAYGYYWRYFDDYIDSQYIHCDKNNQCDITNFILPGGNLSNYIEPSFIFNNMEIWKDVVGYEGIYKINNYGRVINVKNYPYVKEIKQSVGNTGYYRIELSKNNESISYFIHRLVAEAFIPNPDNLPCVNHKDEIKTNNFDNNLEWCTQKYNNNYGLGIEKRAKTRRKVVEKYDLNSKKTIESFQSISEASKITDIKHGHISLVCNRKRKSAGGFGWRYG